MKEPTKPINISISEKGIYFDNYKFDMLQYKLPDFGQTQQFNHTTGSVQWNCVLSYIVDVCGRGFISQLDIWIFDKSHKPQQTDFENVITYFKNSPIDMNNFGCYKLLCNLNSSITENETIKVPTGHEFISYKCKWNKKVLPGSTRITIYGRIFEPTLEYKEAFNKKAHDLFKAVLSNDYFKAKESIDAGADASFINKKFLTTPLDHAIVKNNYGLCELLLKNGADINHINGYGPELSSLNLALHCGFVDSARVLIKYGAKYDIFEMINNNNYMLSIFLQAGGNPNKGFRTIFNPLMYAAFLGNLHAARLLLEHGADVNARTVFDGSALRIAVHMNNLKMASLLLENGAVIDSYIISNLLLDNKDKYKDMIRLLSLNGGKIHLPLLSDFKYKDSTFKLAVPFYLTENFNAFAFLWYLLFVLLKK